jgi:hypothetical protein
VQLGAQNDVISFMRGKVLGRIPSRHSFFQELEALLRYFQFENRDEVLAFIFKGLELDPGGYLLALFTRSFRLLKFLSATRFAFHQRKDSLDRQVVKNLVGDSNQLHFSGFFAKGIAAFGILGIDVSAYADF